MKNLKEISLQQMMWGMEQRKLTKKVEELKHFIRSTCKRCTDESAKYKDFHKNLISFYFEARNVEIFYDKRKIVAEIFVGNNYVAINFDCLDLSVFLSSCVKKDQQSLKVYRNYIKTLSTKTDDPADPVWKQDSLRLSILSAPRQD